MTDVDGVEVPSALVEALVKTNLEIKRLSTAADSIKELIKGTMGEREYATVDGEPVIRWAHVKTRRLDMDELRRRIDPAELAECYVQDITRRFIPLTPKRSAA